MIDLSKYKNVTYIDHPLLKHKITRIRDKNTGTNEFRTIVKEIAMIGGYEAMRNVPTKLVEIETPLEKTEQPVISRENMVIVPILRAGLGMADGLVELVPGVSCGHIGLYRGKDRAPIEYYCKLPGNIENRHVYLVDPMLATGGSSIAAVEMLRKHGAKDITFICIVAAPEGIKAFCDACPDVPLYVGALDRELDEKAYIRPGLGDCGDRVFGTVK